MQNAECRMQNAECRMQNAEAARRTLTARAARRTSECPATKPRRLSWRGRPVRASRMQNAECRMQKRRERRAPLVARASHRNLRPQSGAGSRQADVRRRALISACLLPSAFCILPSAFCLLPSAFCILHSAFRPHLSVSVRSASHRVHDCRIASRFAAEADASSPIRMYACPAPG
jgi:hypothetical protein